MCQVTLLHRGPSCSFFRVLLTPVLTLRHGTYSCGLPSLHIAVCHYLLYCLISLSVFLENVCLVRTRALSLPRQSLTHGNAHWMFMVRMGQQVIASQRYCLWVTFLTPDSTRNVIIVSAFIWVFFEFLWGIDHQVTYLFKINFKKLHSTFSGWLFWSPVKKIYGAYKEICRLNWHVIKCLELKHTINESW